MYLTILKLFSPFLQRYAAKKTAAYLQARRRRRLGLPEPEPEPECPPPSDREGNRAPLWFAAGGILVGGAVGYALAYLTHRSD